MRKTIITIMLQEPMYRRHCLVPDRVVHAVVNSFARVCTIFSVKEVSFFFTIFDYSYFLHPFCPFLNVSDLVEFRFSVKTKVVFVCKCVCC